MLFEHTKNLPSVFPVGFSGFTAVAVSTRPRPKEGSYMPVFNAGVTTARALGAALQIPVTSFSHQEGHIEAVKHYSSMAAEDKLICFHFSGGRESFSAARRNREQNDNSY